jgi:hypothetical protein
MITTVLPSCVVLPLISLVSAFVTVSIQKIYQMATDVVDGYAIKYANKHDKPLPQDTIDKIMQLYLNWIERRCIEVVCVC